ncbi:MAG: MFS transporter [Candidatus Obscuribacterales bacterium]|nr:MFS transporter [Candidatus Obscuribacterales bacterium]
MKYIIALREPPLAALWVSQVLSGIGDQLYMLAAMWIAVERFGNQAGYVAAAIGVGRITFGLFGGIIADRFDRRRIMIVSDIVRFLAVAPLAFIACSGTIHLWHLIVAGALMGAFGAFFDPALQASLPSITRSQSSLEAMTGLMDLTQRLARAIGPALTGLLVAIMPITQFFTIEAFSFLISALTIVVLRSHLTWAKEENTFAPYQSVQDLFKDIVEGFSYAAKDKAFIYCLCSLAFLGGLWGIAFAVGYPILVKQSFGNNVVFYGYIVASYGVGNVLGNVLCANLHVRSSWINVFGGDVLCGLGFVLVALGNCVQAAILGSVLAAIGGAGADLLLLNLIMKEVPSNLLGKMMSLRMMVLSGGYAMGLIVAAPFFKIASACTVIAWCGALMVLTCGYGAVRFANYKKA